MRQANEPARLLRALEATKESQARRRIRQRLSELGPAAAPALLEALKRANAFTRWEAVNLLGELRDPRTLDAVLEFALTETERHAAWRALWALSRFDRAKTLPRLLIELEGPASYRRWRAALALTLHGRKEAGDVLLETLASPDDWQVWEALGGLKALALEGAEAAISKHLDTERPRAIRQQAVLALGAIARRRARSGRANGRAVKALEAALADPHPQVRWRASMALAGCGPGVVGLLAARLRIESDESVMTQLRNDIERLGGGA